MNLQTTASQPSIRDYKSVTSPEAFLVDWPTFYPAAYIRGQALRKVTRHEAGKRYGDADAQVMNIFYPSRQTADAKVYVHLHGGAFSEGHPDFYDFVGERLLEEGFIFVSMGYRLAPTRFPDSAVDVAQGLACLDQHLKSAGVLRPSYCISGHSAGASIAALLGVRPEITEAQGFQHAAISCMVLISGIYDFTPSDPAHVFVDEDRRIEASAVLHGRHAPKRTLMIYGDPEVNLKANSPDLFKVRAVALEGALRSNGHHVVRHEMKGADHKVTACALDDDKVFATLISTLGDV